MRTAYLGIVAGMGCQDIIVVHPTLEETKEVCEQEMAEREKEGYSVINIFGPLPLAFDSLG